MSTLVVENISKSFGGVKAVQGVSFEVGPGQILALIGPNGAGKSTCFNMLNGQLRADTGSVRLDGAAVASSAMRRGVTTIRPRSATSAARTDGLKKVSRNKTGNTLFMKPPILK